MPPLLEHLQAMYHNVRQAVFEGDPTEWGRLGHNAKGDPVKWFDLAADRAVCQYLERDFPAPVRLWSEEGPPRDFGSGPPEFIMVLDPVDGSRNFSRGLPLSAMAACLFPGQGPVSAGTVEYSLVGHLFSGDIWQAARGRGAFHGGERLRPQPLAASLAEALYSGDVDGVGASPALIELLISGHGLRSFGAAILGLTMVATGQVDAHVDLRGELTPENYLAPALLITEVGGRITDPGGQPLPPVTALTDKVSLVAAADPGLHAALLERIADLT